MNIYKFNEFLQRLCLKCVSQIASNSDNCHLLCDIGIIRNIEMSLLNLFLKNWRRVISVQVRKDSLSHGEGFTRVKVMRFFK